VRNSFERTRRFPKNIKLVYVILELSGLDVLPARVLKH